MKLLLVILLIFCAIWVFLKFIGYSFKKGVFRSGLITPAGYHVRDRRVYYYSGLMNDTVRELLDVDAGSFEVLKHTDAPPHTVTSTVYARDHSRVFYYGLLIPGADATTFRVTGPDRGRDKGHIFDRLHAFCNDPDYYRHMKDDLYIDRNHIYRDTLIISDEPDNIKFEVTANSKSMTYYADSKGLFASNGMRMPEVDIRTFRPLPGNYCADAKHVYVFDDLELKIIEGVNPATFVVPKGKVGHFTITVNGFTLK